MYLNVVAVGTFICSRGCFTLHQIETFARHSRMHPLQCHVHHLVASKEEARIALNCLADTSHYLVMPFVATTDLAWLLGRGTCDDSKHTKQPSNFHPVSIKESITLPPNSTRNQQMSTIFLQNWRGLTPDAADLDFRLRRQLSILQF